MPEVQFDANAFIKTVENIFLGGIKRLLGTAAADLAKDGLARQLGEMTGRAIIDGDKPRIELLKSGMPWLLTYYKFKLTNEQNAAFTELFTTVTDTLVSVIPLVIAAI